MSGFCSFMLVFPPQGQTYNYNNHTEMKKNLIRIIMAFAVGTSLSSYADVTGQWDFNGSNFTATVGQDMGDFATDYLGYPTPTPTTFTTATIDGQTAVVMAFPACTMNEGYLVYPGVPSTEGYVLANRYTLIMDIMYPAASSGSYRALIQINDPENLSDAELFVNSGNGIGISTIYDGLIKPDVWHRVVFVFDLRPDAETGLVNQFLRKYIDGILVGEQDLGAPDGRWALRYTALLFTDEDGETAPGFVNSIQFRDDVLTDTQVFALGKASAAGIPQDIPVFTDLAVTLNATSASDVVGMNGTYFTSYVVGNGTYAYQWYRDGTALPDQTHADLRITNVQISDSGSYTLVVNNGLQWVTSAPPSVLTVNPAPGSIVTGQWDFNQGNLDATTGQPLQYFNATVEQDTHFGTTTSFGISDIAGEPASVMYFTPSLSSWGGYVMTPNIGGNGGGTKANQYTLIFDLLSPSTSAGYRALFQTNPENTDDAEAFFNGANGLGISQIYQGLLTPDAWHRVVLAFDLTQREFGKYIDGVSVLTGPIGTSPLGVHDAQYLSTSTNVLDGGSVDMRWSLGPTVLLLADEDGDLKPMYISSIQIRSGRMTDAEIAALGGATASKIPGGLSLKATKSGNSIIIDWTGGALESAPTPTGPWSKVAGAAPQHVITHPTGNQFFRVRQ